MNKFERASADKMERARRVFPEGGYCTTIGGVEWLWISDYSEDLEEAARLCRMWCTQIESCRRYVDILETAPSLTYNTYAGETPTQRIARRRKMKESEDLSVLH